MLCQAHSFAVLKLEDDGEQLIKQMWKGVEVLYRQLKGKVHPCTGTEVLYRPYGP
jgi:hypothetical protein